VTYYADLSSYEFWPMEREMLNVGWLDRDHSFSIGGVAQSVIDALLVLADDQQQLTRGSHSCQFCDAESPIEVVAPVPEGTVWLGMGEIHVESAVGQWYAAPSMVVHYITEHRYQPPEDFQDAVLRHVAERPAVLNPNYKGG
jgi:hypothetical protein